MHSLSAGFLFDYLCYATVHHLVHYRPGRQGSLFFTLKRRHALHHHVTPEGNFGVTSGLREWVFATDIQPRRNPRRAQPNGRHLAERWTRSCHRFTARKDDDDVVPPLSGYMTPKRSNASTVDMPASMARRTLFSVSAFSNASAIASRSASRGMTRTPSRSPNSMSPGRMRMPPISIGTA
ncbi:fatty acid hydroxylase family protein [Ensifer adhaerens]|nr:fatty acid hydroxylase family protein [Ensifer canadensis]